MVGSSEQDLPATRPQLLGRDWHFFGSELHSPCLLHPRWRICCKPNVTEVSLKVRAETCKSILQCDRASRGLAIFYFQALNATICWSTDDPMMVREGEGTLKSGFAHVHDHEHSDGMHMQAVHTCLLRMQLFASIRSVILCNRNSDGMEGVLLCKGRTCSRGLNSRA